MQLEYYGIDWVAMVLTLVAIYLLGNKHWFGFVLMIIGNLCWIALGALSDSIALMVANAAFIGMNIRGIWKWRREDQEEQAGPTAASET